MIGDVFANIAVREPQPRASEAFRLFGEQHRNMERIGQEMLQDTKPVRARFTTLKIQDNSNPSMYNKQLLIVCIFVGIIRSRYVLA